MAGSMARALLGANEDAVRLIRIAALLHDIGHGPFSHVSEAALVRYADRTSIKPGQNPHKIHELVTAKLIMSPGEIVDEAGANTCRDVVDLLGPGHGEPLWRSIVSGPLDADKQDYLLRDSRFCGVDYGVFDMRQLHRSLTPHGTEHMRTLMIKRDGVHAVEQFALAKYYMMANVYRHRVRLVTDQMIVRAIVRGIDEDEIAPLRELYSYDGSDNFVSNYADWDDARFMMEFCQNRPDTRCGRLLERLRSRRLLKAVFRCRSVDLAAEVREPIANLMDPALDDVRQRVQAGLAKELKTVTQQEIDPGEVILHHYELKSVSKSVQNDEGIFNVLTDSGVSGFDRESALFRSMAANSGVDEFVEVYAPVDMAAAERTKRFAGGFATAIKSVIETECRVDNGKAHS